MVPVLYAAGRTLEPVTPSVIRHFAQKRFTLAIVFPARMSVMMYAAWRETTRVPFTFAFFAGQTWAPSASRILRIVWRGMRMPPLPIVPKALIMSIGCTTRVPMLSDGTATVPF